MQIATRRSLRRFFVVLTALAAAEAGCSGEGDGSTSTAPGGATGTAATTGVGGVSGPTTAGTVTTSGATAGSGGTSTTGSSGGTLGGTATTGGASATSGAVSSTTGGVATTGGIVSTGGTATTGGTTSTGGAGNSTTGENTSAGGAATTGGTAGTGGAGTADCNTISDQPIVEVNSGDNLQGALDAIGSSNSTPTIVRIAPGTYDEKLVVDTPNITLCGQVGQADNTVLSYNDGEGTTTSAAIRINADDVSGENLTLQNTFGQGSQAVALLIHGNRVQFRNTRFLGFQDTLYVRGERNYFRDCYVRGTVDFIFGDATAVFENCTIHSVNQVGGAITAPSTTEDREFGIVFLGGVLSADGDVNDGAVHLGRNWRPYGNTVFIGTEMGAHISSVGWVKMGDNELSTARFAEYGSTGPGADPYGRAPEAQQLSESEAANHTVENVLSPWVPSYSE